MVESIAAGRERLTSLGAVNTTGVRAPFQSTSGRLEKFNLTPTQAIPYPTPWPPPNHRPPARQTPHPHAHPTLRLMNITTLK
jgi:hypothetical protein